VCLQRVDGVLVVSRPADVGGHQQEPGVLLISAQHVHDQHVAGPEGLAAFRGVQKPDDVLVDVGRDLSRPGGGSPPAKAEHGEVWPDARFCHARLLSQGTGQ
jgi:hypothetical protein